MAGKRKRQTKKYKQINQAAIQQAQEQKLTKKKEENIMAKDKEKKDVNDNEIEELLDHNQEEFNNEQAENIDNEPENIDNQPKEQTISQKINALDALVGPALNQIQEQINSAHVTTEDQKENLKVLAGVLLQTQEHIQTLNAIPDPSELLNDELNTQYQQLVTSCNSYKEQFNVADVNKEIDGLIKFRNENYTELLQATAQDFYDRYTLILNSDDHNEDQKKKALEMQGQIGKSFGIKTKSLPLQGIPSSEYLSYQGKSVFEQYINEDFTGKVNALCTANDELKKAKSAEQRYLATKAILGTATVLYETTKAFGKTSAALTKNLAGLVKDCITYTVREFAINPAKAFATDVYSGVEGGVDISGAKKKYNQWKDDSKIAAAKVGKIAQLVVANFIPVAIGGGVGLAAGTVTGTAKATWGATKGLAYAPVASFKDIKDRAVAIKDEGFSSAKTARENIKQKTSHAENIRKKQLKEKFTGVQRRT